MKQRGKHVSVKQPAQAKPTESDLGSLRDQLGDDVLGQLRQLKTDLHDAQEEQRQLEEKQRQAEEKRRRMARSGHNPETAEEEDVNFAELFTPKVSKEADSFADLLKDSKLDWRKFK